MDAAAAGRKPTELKAPWRGVDLLYASQRVDTTQIEGAEYEHCTFANVSFKDARIANGRFLDCVFVNCYFRRADLAKTQFIGCKFVDCNLRKVSISGGDFSYTEFVSCYFPFEEFRHALPSQQNLRQALAEQCAIAADGAGDAAEARKYRLTALDARREHLEAAVKGGSNWYAEHYKGFDKIPPAAELLWYWVNRILWRHGESALRLLLTASVLVFAVFPLLAYAALASQGYALGDVIWWSLGNFLSMSHLSPSDLPLDVARPVAVVEGIAGIAFAGLYVSLLVKGLMRR